jgi:transcriptional regulator with XRE-family HTH domain
LPRGPDQERLAYRRLGERILELLHQQNMRQKDLADALSVSNSWLNQVIHGDKPSLELIRRIDSYLGTAPELEELLREARTPHTPRPPDHSIQADERPLAYDFFYTWESRPDLGFVSVISDACRVDVFSRTAVNVLGLYHRAIERRMEDGCEFRFLMVQRGAKRSEFIYGTNPESFVHNQAVSGAMLRRLFDRYGHRSLQVRATPFTPTFAMMIVERAHAADSRIYIQIYFMHGPTNALDRPAFMIHYSDPWYDVFRNEFVETWGSAEPWPPKPDDGCGIDL